MLDVGCYDAFTLISGMLRTGSHMPLSCVPDKILK
jgi:hypothetical protein